jgi:hypothetical protein
MRIDSYHSSFMRPLSTASLQQLRRWFWILLVMNSIYVVAVHFILQPVTSGEIVRFEMAKEASIAQTMLDNWKISGNFHKAVTSVYIDFLFILLYGAGLAIACVFLARLTKHEILGRAGKFFSYLLVIAAVCDVIENIAMLRSMQGVVKSFNVMLAYDMAFTKFSIIILSLLFIIICLIFWGLNFIESGSKNSSKEITL